jgi:hypothetical protein
VPLPYIIVYGAFVCSAGRYTRRLLSYLSSNIFIQTASTADKRPNKAHKTPEFTLRDDLLLCFAASPATRAIFLSAFHLRPLLAGPSAWIYFISSLATAFARPCGIKAFLFLLAQQIAYYSY